MKRPLLITLLTTMVATSYGQLHFSIDNKNPCAGQLVTFSLPSIPGCSNPRVASESDWKISPSPSPREVRYNFSSQNGVKGYTSVTLTYSAYHPTITVKATYSCNGKSSGTISDVITMMPPLTGKPAISGLDGNIYSGDPTTATVSLANTISYSWKLSIVQTVSGSIGQSAIVSPGSQQTIINWPADFTGIVDVIATVNGCSESKQSTKRITVLSPPSIVFYESSVVPSAHCAGTSMRYRLEVFGGFTITQTQVIVTGGATDITVFNTKNGVPIEWSVKWMSDGDIRLRYSVSNGSLVWRDNVTSTLTFDVLEYNAGQIHPIPIASYCAPMAITLSLDRQPTGSPYVFQYCNSGDCSVASSNWINNDPLTSPSFTGITTNTSFRIKLTDNRCGTFQSASVTVAVKPTPSITVSDEFIFSGGTFGIPSASLSFSIVTVKTSSTNVTGASDASIMQGSSTGTLATQTLVARGSLDGTVAYSITPSKDGCTGQTRNAILTVYQKPVIFAAKKYVYKGGKTTLTTGNYDSYLWQMQSGKILGNDPTLEVVAPNDYSVTVTKNGARGTSDPLTIGRQFSGVNENYIITRQPSRKFTSIAGLEDYTERDVTESIQYFDGLGRSLQNIGIRMSPSGRDVVQLFVYDQHGRQAIKYLPYVSSEDNGRIRSDGVVKEQTAFYQRNDPTIPFDRQPFAETVFENSPLNRLLKQGAPGTAWQPNPDHPDLEHVVRHKYLLNTAADSVLRFTYDYENRAVTSSYFSSGTLYKNITIDEDNNDVIEFVDKLNRTICKKVKAGNNVYACTYYVFDDLGNLAVVVPPEGSRRLSP